MNCKYFASLFLVLILAGVSQAQSPSAQQLASWLKRFPEADTNKDGALSVEEAMAYRSVLQGKKKGKGSNTSRAGAPRKFEVDPGWEKEAFPEHAVSLKSPEEIAAIYSEVSGSSVTSYEKPEDGILRIVGTGHSFMTPGYGTFLRICKAAGFEQPLLTHTGGGMTGSTRYKWEQENGIFQFDGKPQPKLLASIANGEWEAMMWGPYFNDKPAYYSCWIDFCLKYNPGMKFYLSDAWPQLYQFEKAPTSEDVFTAEKLDQLRAQRSRDYVDLVGGFRKDYGETIFILPTCDAMVIAAKHFLKGELPGVEGIHSAVGEKEARALWRDPLGHLGPGFERLEGYVFYATVYGRSPELIEGDVKFGGDPDFPGPELDRIFRKIAWEAVTGNSLSGVVDEDGDGFADTAEDK